MPHLRRAVNTILSRSTGYVVTKDPASTGGRPTAGSPDDERVDKLSQRLNRAEDRIKKLRRHGVSTSQRTIEQTLERLAGIPLEKLSLTDIANLEGTDKGTVGPFANWPAHNYTDVYEAYLARLRQQPINLLEVGLGVPGEFWDARMAQGRNAGGGASLRMWHGYFPRAMIYGADINAAPHLDNERTKTFVLDQGDPQAVAAFLDSIGDVSFDVIIDDGSHKPDHQQVSLGCLFPRLKSGGLYIIEDLLANGKGDGKSNRMSSDTALNTRRVLKSFSRDGNFESPHALEGAEYLASHIDQLNFHVPRRPGVPETECVCVLRKT